MTKKNTATILTHSNSTVSSIPAIHGMRLPHAVYSIHTMLVNTAASDAPLSTASCKGKANATGYATAHTAHSTRTTRYTALASAPVRSSTQCSRRVMPSTTSIYSISHSSHCSLPIAQYYRKKKHQPATMMMKKNVAIKCSATNSSAYKLRTMRECLGCHMKCSTFTTAVSITPSDRYCITPSTRTKAGSTRYSAAYSRHTMRSTVYQLRHLRPCLAVSQCSQYTAIASSSTYPKINIASCVVSIPQDGDFSPKSNAVDWLICSIVD